MKFFKHLLSILIFFPVITSELRGQSGVVVDEIIMLQHHTVQYYYY